jgi:molybdopterin molybdotransferase
MPALLPVAEALARILDGATPAAAEDVPLALAAKRVLAEDLAARLTQPPFDASAMDGYAVRGEDVRALPATLTLIGVAAAGRRYTGSVGRGECVRIFTGAPVPRGADAIVIQENTRRTDTSVAVVEGSPDPAHIRGRGKDFAEGDVLLHKGRLLEARTLTLAAAMGHARLPVRARPRVAILATGDELVEPGTVPGPDQIVSSNPYGLHALVAAAGGAPALLGIARDSESDIERMLGEARDADVIVTIGGASVGDRDLVAPALEARGMALDFWKIAMRPGKPLLFGRIGTQRVLGLPGNPVSSLVCARVFLVPLVRALLGLVPEPTGGKTAVMSHALEANGPRAHYMRATLDASRTPPTATTIADQDSSLMVPLAAADALVVRAPGAGALPPGSEVPILRLDF